jgi:hypothetical protein
MEIFILTLNLLQKEQEYRRWNSYDIFITKKHVLGNADSPSKTPPHCRIIAPGDNTLEFDFNWNKLVILKNHKINFFPFGRSPIEDLLYVTLPFKNSLFEFSD